MRSSVFLAVALCLAATGAHAGVTINGTTITFNDNTMQSTANPPSDHGGTGTTVSGTYAFVGGGYGNTASGNRSTISGGDNNSAGDYASTVGGGNNNSVSGNNSTIGGGNGNLVTDDYGTIGGGQGNQAGNNEGTTSDTWFATVGGGFENVASGVRSTVAGGFRNSASGSNATVGGGFDNAASQVRSTVSGGIGNTASGPDSVVGGGSDNMADGGWSTVGGGFLNIASGQGSTVAGGRGNAASGFYSFAAGIGASDGGYDNVFVWDDGTGSDATAANTFNVNASGGIFFNGGSIHAPSDRNMKEAFSFVSAREVLDKVVEMPVSTWRFKSEDDSVRHIGPMAQDFMAAFGYGKSDKHIVSTDADGVALAAIQGLYAMQREELQEQSEVNTALRWHNAQLEARLTRLEKAILRESVSEPTGTD